MARRAQVEEVVPETLPDGFDHWDGGEPPPPATLPKDFDNFDEAPDPRVGSSAPRVVVAAPGNAAEMPVRRISAKSPVHAMPTPAHISPPAPNRTQKFPITREPAVVPQQTGTITLNLRQATAPATQSAKYVTTEELSTLVDAYYATQDEESDGEKQRKKNRMIKWIGVILLVLAIVAAVLVLTLHKPAVRSQGVVVVRNPVVTYTPDATPSREKPSPSKPAQQP